MKLKYVVITSVDRDDLPDRGAGHFAECVKEVRALNPGIKIEILVPDFRGRITQALEKLKDNPPDVFNHNLENVPRLYKEIRPGADYQWSLKLLHDFKEMFPNIPTKSGLMVGLGETNEEILEVMKDLRANGVTMLTLVNISNQVATTYRLHAMCHQPNLMSSVIKPTQWALNTQLVSICSLFLPC